MYPVQHGTEVTPRGGIEFGDPDKTACCCSWPCGPYFEVLWRRRGRRSLGALEGPVYALVSPGLEGPVRRLLPVLLMSGAAALIYELCWIRQVALLCGGTVASAAVGTGTFIAGLGLGAILGGWWADRRPAGAMRAYAIAEGLVALSGLGLALVLPSMHLEPSWSIGSNGWFWGDDLLVRLAVVAGLLGPPAVLMGTTLPLALRHAVPRSRGSRGWTVGVLVAANTLGAAVGALATDLGLVPAVGVLWTQLIAVGLSGAAAASAWMVHRWAVDAPVRIANLAPPRPLIEGRQEGPGVEGTLSPVIAGVALALSGAAVLSLEVVWFRFLGSALGHFRAVLALTLACVLLGLWAGELGAGALSRRVPPARVFVWGQGLGVALVVAAFAAHDPYRVLEAQLSLSPLVANLVPTAMLVLPAAAALGAGLPMALAAVRAPASGAGRQTGALLAANAGGNLLGAVATGLVVLPALGMQATVWLACGAALLAGLLVAVADGGTVAAGPRLTLSAPLLTGGVALFWLADQPPDRLLWAAFPHGRVDQEGVLAVDEGTEYTVVVTGEIDGPARLWTSGHPMASTTLHAQRYMRVMAHLPLLLQDAPERALVICFGVGNTAHAVSLHPSITHLDIADLSPDVLEQAAWFDHANDGVLEDPRVRVFVDDGRRVLAGGDAPWDLVVLEPPPIGYAGVSALYSRELYTQARARLSPTGCLSQWAPLYQVPVEAQMSLVRSFSDVFPDGVVIVADRRELVLVGCREGAPAVTLRDVQRRLDGRKAVSLDLSRLGIADAGDLLARFGGGGLPAVTAGYRAVTAEDPLLEYSQMSQVTETRMPATLFDPAGISRWCADCAVPNVDYSDEAFLRFSNRPDR